MEKLGYNVLKVLSVISIFLIGYTFPNKSLDEFLEINNKVSSQDLSLSSCTYKCFYDVDSLSYKYTVNQHSDTCLLHIGIGYMDIMYYYDSKDTLGLFPAISDFDDYMSDISAYNFSFLSVYIFTDLNDTEVNRIIYLARQFTLKYYEYMGQTETIFDVVFMCNTNHVIQSLKEVPDYPPPARGVVD